MPPQVGEVAVDGLQRVGVQSAERDMKEMFCYSLEALGDIGLTSAENNLSKLVRQVIDSAGVVGLTHLSPESISILTNVLGDIGIRADEKGLVETAWAAHVLGSVAVKASASENHALRQQVLSALKGIVQQAVEKKLSYFAKLMQDAVNLVEPMPASKVA